jgi:hypothetical protein
MVSAARATGSVDMAFFSLGFVFVDYFFEAVMYAWHGPCGRGGLMHHVHVVALLNAEAHVLTAKKDSS